MMAKTSVNFEEALNMTGFGKFNILALLVTLSLIMGMTFETVSVAYLVPASACDFDTTVAQQGLMAGMPLLGIIASSYFQGYMADIRGRRRVLGWSMWVAFVCGGAAALFPNWIVFCVLKFMSAGALAGTIPLSLAWLSECTPQHKRSILVSLTTSIYLVTTGCMAVLAIPVLQLKFSYYIPYFNIYFTSWRLLNLVFASTCAVGAICMFSSYESPRYYLCMGKEEKALVVLRGIFATNSGKKAEDYEVTSVVLGEDTGAPNKGMFSSMVAQTVPLLRPPLLKNTILLSALFIIAYTGISPFILWLPFIADSVMKAQERGEAMSFCQMLQSTQNSTLTETSDCSLNTFALVTVFVTSMALGVINIILSTVINYVGRKRMVIAVQIVAGIAGMCVNATNSWIIGTVCLMVYLSGTVNFGFMTTFSVDVFPTYVKAMAVCLTLMVGRVSSVMGINILKYLLVTDCQLAFYCFAGLTLVGGFIALLLPSDVKKTCKKENGSYQGTNFVR
ncbi:putative transporter svop-1 [Maniola jurtina]|uniref:putative transporter svop-1 n=1 Tax=Maniola jurtina TaxID=191418 RepID=UPI001E6868DE|nr:putative transporter svop-1 [Maniola jurtina]XP_045767298.1 putative transporter svop-1 [Maniola jurtina]